MGQLGVMVRTFIYYQAILCIIYKTPPLKTITLDCFILMEGEVF